MCRPTTCVRADLMCCAPQARARARVHLIEVAWGEEGTCVESLFILESACTVA